jgi:hypothetical protein
VSALKKATDCPNRHACCSGNLAFFVALRELFSGPKEAL